jgi:hypothetical protein
VKSGLIIRHVPHEGIAGFREPIEAAGYVLDRIDVADPCFATLDLAEPDLLIMMGGPMAVYEHEQYPWIRCQQRRLARRLELDRPTLGVCFGAQLMAAALGAEVYRGPAKEIGFHPIDVHDAAGRCATLPASRCCTGTATPSRCPNEPNCSPRANAIRTRRFAAGPTSSGCSSTPRWGSTSASTCGPSSGPMTSPLADDRRTLRSDHSAAWRAASSRRDGR